MIWIHKLRYDPTGKILQIYDQPSGKTDAVAMQHDVDYSICGDDKKCKNAADRKMVKHWIIFLGKKDNGGIGWQEMQLIQNSNSVLVQKTENGVEW